LYMRFRDRGLHCYWEDLTNPAQHIVFRTMATLLVGKERFAALMPPSAD
jgi:hypothetical protein